MNIGIALFHPDWKDDGIRYGKMGKLWWCMYAMMT